MKNSTIRIKDIALKAQVSTGTVDRVLHNRGRVAEKVRLRIQSIIDESKYEPNMMARALGSKKQYQLAALIPDHEVDAYWYAPKTGIEKAAKELKQFGIQVHQFIFNPYQADSFVQVAAELSKMRPDGILLSPIFYRESLPFFEKWKALEIPFVLFNTEIEEYRPLSYIGQDSYQSGKLAGKLMHYGQSGPCSILVAHIDEDISNSAHLLKKEKGLRDYFLESDEAGEYNIVRVELDRSNPASFDDKLDEILKEVNDLKHIFVTTSKAHHIATYLEKRNIKRVRIVGYDLLPQNLEHLNKGHIGFLINQNPKGQGFQGINQLADHLVFKKTVAPTKFLPLDVVTKENLHYYLDEEEASLTSVMVPCIEHQFLQKKSERLKFLFKRSHL
jgi:LacI family transcriptional regulator